MKQSGRKHTKSLTGKGVFPSRYAATLLIPIRNVFLSPKTLISRLDLAEDHEVLEIGPGPGYFSLPVAGVLAQGRLVLLDIQQEMLDFSRRRLEKKNLHNVEYRLGDGTRFGLEDNRFDRVFMVAVIGEVQNRDEYLDEIHRVLSGDGLLSISELAGDPDRLSMDELTALVCPHGFALAATFGTKRNYTLNFRKTGS